MEMSKLQASVGDHRPYADLVAYIEIDLLRVREDYFFRISDVNQPFVAEKPGLRRMRTGRWRRVGGAGSSKIAVRSR